MEGCGSSTCERCAFYIGEMTLGPESKYYPWCHIFHPEKLLQQTKQQLAHATQVIHTLENNPRPSGKDFFEAYKLLLRLPCKESADSLRKKLWRYLKLNAKKGGTYSGKCNGQPITKHFSDISQWYPSGAVRMCDATDATGDRKFQAPMSRLKFNHRVSVRQTMCKPDTRQQRKVADEARRRSQRAKQQARARQTEK